MTASPRVAVVGAGNMGANHARVVAASPRAELAMVLDVDADRADAVARPLGVEGSTDLAAAAGCDAVVVAATTEVHLDIALPLLEAGVSCLVEKPLADDLVAVDRLI
nr:Gfo/Idh/MocA family oxidoreductase [Microthrixaceae bacterium]